MTMIDHNSFLICITVAELNSIIVKKNQFTLQTSDGHIINNEARFLDAVYRSLPIPPPPFSLPPPPNKPLNKDALGDDLFNGFHFLKGNEVVVIWPFADDVARSSMFFLVKAVKFLKQVADDLKSYSYDDSGNEYNVSVRLFLVCSNKESREALKKEFWFLE